MLDSIAYLNSEWLPLREARIPVLDRGFLFGDGVYDALIAYEGTPFHDDAHIARLDRSLQKICLGNPFTAFEWKMLIRTLIQKNSSQRDHSIFIEVTRGLWDGQLRFTEQAQPTIFMMSLPYSAPDIGLLTQGINAVTAEDMRSRHRDIKATSMLSSLLAKHIATTADAAETILFRDNYLTEGASSNIVMVINGTLCTPPKDNLSLPGVTCDVVVDLASQHGVPINIRPISRSEVEQADELWLTSTLRQIMAITALDGKPVGAAAWRGKPGPLFERIVQWFEAEKERVKQYGAGQQADAPIN